MNKFSITAVILFIAGIASFAVAGYVWGTLNDLYAMLANYNLEDQYYTNPKTAAMIFDLKFGIIKFAVLGFAFWILAIIFFLKRKSFN